MTKIFDPNVSEKGEICVNTLKRDWNPKQWSLYNLFEVIKCLLIVPFPQSSLNEEAGKMFMDNYDEYFRVAKMLTEIHAKKKVIKKDEDDNIDMEKEKDKDDINNNKNEKEENKNKDEDIIMENNNESAKKEKNSEDKKVNKIEIINEDIDNEKSDSNSKDEMNNSFIYDNLNGENKSCSLFCNNNNTDNSSNNNHIFNFDNDNFFDNFNITRSKTIKFGERPKFNFFHLNSQGESATSQIFHNSINQFSRMNSISSINSSISNISNYEIQKVSTFKEKPKLGSLPLMSSNSIKTKSKNNPYGFIRSKTLNLSKNNK